MTGPEVLDLGREAIWVLVQACAPAMLVALVVGTVIGLLQALREAWGALSGPWQGWNEPDLRRFWAAMDALLPLGLAATDRQGIGACVEALSYACQYCVSTGDLEEGERVLGLLAGHLCGLDLFLDGAGTCNGLSQTLNGKKVSLRAL